MFHNWFFLNNGNAKTISTFGFAAKKWQKNQTWPGACRHNLDPAGCNFGLYSQKVIDLSIQKEKEGAGKFKSISNKICELQIKKQIPAIVDPDNKM